MAPLTLAFTDEARAFLQSEGHSDFTWPSVNMPAVPCVGDWLWLDDADPMTMLIVVKRTFTRSLLSEDIGITLELGMPPAGE